MATNQRLSDKVVFFLSNPLSFFILKILRNFQGCNLPAKFKVDERKAHPSNLIFSEQITKQQTLEEIEKPPYPEQIFKQNYDFVIKKSGMTKVEFEDYMKTPPAPHSAFRMNQTINNEFPFLRLFKPLISRL